ncbi:MAG: hypothetical protein ACRDQ5_16950, partial [Sciscionella sp.]
MDDRTAPDNLPAFDGVVEVVELLGTLYARPTVGDNPPGEYTRWERRGRRGLPMVCLVRPDEHRALLPALLGRLAGARPYRVPHAYVDLERDSGSGEPGSTVSSELSDKVRVTKVRSALQSVSGELAKSVNAKAGRIRFRRFDLLDWLMSEDLSDVDTGKRGSELRTRLRQRDIAQRFDDMLSTIGKRMPDVPAWLRWIPAVLRLLPPLLFAIQVTGRVPLISGEYRWFLRQPNLAPEVPGGFVGFAERLTKGEWTNEAPEQLARLMTNALLADLRRAYRWRPWQLRGARRTTYAVVLLDNITRNNGGYALLKLINDVRNETGRFDPLLVVSASRKVPPDALDPPGPVAKELEWPAGSGTRRLVYDAVNARDGYAAWQSSLLADRRARRDTAWYLPVAVPGRPTEPQRAQLEQRLSGVRPYRMIRPPLWSGRLLRVSVVAVLLLGAAVTYTTWSHKHCGGWTRWPGWSPEVTLVDGQCVGVTDGSFDIFSPSDAQTRKVEAQILKQNQQAEQRRKTTSRPYMTLVALQALTTNPPVTPDSLTAERESLEGVAVAQARQLAKPGVNDPIVRILIANAGAGMHEGRLVARQLGRMADPQDSMYDPSLVGVVGLNLSSQPTFNTITELTNAGLPVVASTLSADHLGDGHPMYFQVSPQNRREAAVAAAFVDYQLQNHSAQDKSVRVYYSDDTSYLYSTNLRYDVLHSFRNRSGFTASARAFTPSGPAPTHTEHQKYQEPLVGDAQQAGQDSCNAKGFVYFAGRGLPDFQEFVDGADQCPQPPRILADDDVTRYVADQAAREPNSAVPFWYQSFAVPPDVNDKSSKPSFYYAGRDSLHSLFPFENGHKSRSLDGHAALAYDATLTMITAVRHLREGSQTIPMTPA